MYCSGQTDRIVKQACTQVSLIEHLLNRLPQAPQVPWHYAYDHLSYIV